MSFDEQKFLSLIESDFFVFPVWLVLFVSGKEFFSHWRSWRCFTILSIWSFNPLFHIQIYNILWNLLCILWGIGNFSYGYPVVQASLIKKFILSPLLWSIIFVAHHMSIYVCVCFFTLSSAPQVFLSYLFGNTTLY